MEYYFIKLIIIKNKASLFKFPLEIGPKISEILLLVVVTRSKENLSLYSLFSAQFFFYDVTEIYQKLKMLSSNPKVTRLLSFLLLRLGLEGVD